MYFSGAHTVLVGQMLVGKGQALNNHTSLEQPCFSFLNQPFYSNKQDSERGHREYSIRSLQ